MTTKQWRMLETLEHFNGHGTIEVCLEFSYDFGDTEADEVKAWNVTRLVVASLVRSLVRKGYATDDDNGYGITEAGRALLENHRARAAKAKPQGRP